MKLVQCPTLELGMIGLFRAYWGQKGRGEAPYAINLPLMSSHHVPGTTRLTKYETENALESDIIKYATICSESSIVFPVVRVTVKEEKFSRHFHDPVIFTGPHPQSHPEILSWVCFTIQEKKKTASCSEI